MTNNLNNRYMLQTHREELERSLAFDDIKDKLYAKFVLNNDDLTSIDELDSNTLKVSACLDLVLNAKNPVVLDAFFSSLKEANVQVNNDMYIKLTDRNGVEDMQRKEGKEALCKGAVPRVYESYIPRDQEGDLEQILQNQKLCEIIIIKGYPLVGKTSFVSRVLQNNPALVFTSFQNMVIWLDLRNVTEKDRTSIEDSLKRVIGRITNFDQSNFCLQPEQSLEWYTDVLRAKFHEHCMGGLLVLDNVRSKEVLRHFDIGCKMLIIVNRGECEIKQASKQMELNNFTKKETVACFVSALPLLSELRVNNIHQCLEGHPQLVTKLADYLKGKQADKWDPQRWNEWFALFLPFGILHKSLEHIASLLLKLLSEKEQKYFMQLAILPEYANIFPEVLRVYWGISDLHAVEDILNRFYKLDLVEQKFEDGRYIYGIRNLFLKCLKSTQDSGFLIKCHSNLLEAYHRKYGELTMFPNDNYIHNYYGYHLVGANKPVKDFMVFLNIRFIDAKIKYCGVGAMLQDFQMYRTYIIENNIVELTKKLDAYIDFVQKCETNLLKTGLDFVQYALRKTDNHQIVFNDALKSARSTTKLYLRWTFKNEPLFTRTLDVHNRFETILFANDPKLILVGTKTGEIQLWDLDSKLMLLKYIGHTKGITQLTLSPCKKYFLSVSHDMTFKIWKMYVKDTSYSPTVTPAPLSPSLRQRDHHSFFADETCMTAIGNSSLSLPSEISKKTTMSATFYKHNSTSQSSNILSLVTCTNDGHLLQWTFQEIDKCPLQFQRELLVASKIYTFDVVAAGQRFLFIYSQTGRRLYVVDPHLEGDNKYICIVNVPDNSSGNVLQQLLAVNDDLCVVISGNIHIVRFEYVLRKGTMVYHHSMSEISFEDGALSCASLTENGSYLATGTVDGYVFLWDLKSLPIGKRFTTNNCLVIGLDTYTTSNSITLLLSGSDDSTVKCWHIASEHLSQHSESFNGDQSSVCRSMSVQHFQQHQMFSCNWLSNNSDLSIEYQHDGHGITTATVALLDMVNNAIQIYSVSQTHTDKILYTVSLPPRESSDSSDAYSDNCAVILFELDSNALYYVLRDGAVRRFHFRTQSDELLWHCHADNKERGLIVSIKCLGCRTNQKPIGGSSILIGCNRNSLTLIQCDDMKPPTVIDLLYPSKSHAHGEDIVRIFHLRQVFSSNLRIMRLLLAHRSYVVVLCTESIGAQIGGATDAERALLSMQSIYRMDSVEDDCQINDCIISSTESHLVLFLSNGQCNILRLKPVGRELTYVSVHAFQLDPNTKITASAISFDGQLLALGKDNGQIEIIDVARKTTKIILEGHTLPIETLIFSPKPNYILVSSADSLCWWKLQEAANTFEANSNRISQHNEDYYMGVWKTKQPIMPHISEPTQVNKYLLARISLSGPLKHVTASKDFMSFITLDSLGIIHNFNVIPRTD